MEVEIFPEILLIKQTINKKFILWDSWICIEDWIKAYTGLLMNERQLICNIKLINAF